VSFIGRPFPLDEADEHFARLSAWGLTFLRFLVTWEAVEHAGPGIYDEDYLAYLRAVLEKANDYGISVFIDPHQDAWSRWTGGDGAPGWTLEAVGMDLSQLHATGAAFTHQENGDPYPRMIWPTNYYKLGAATMFTLFFAGDDLAPATTIDGVDSRTFLQTHYINAFKRVAEVTADLPNVVGFDTMNEPIRGYIETRDLRRDEPHGLLTLGATPTPFQAMMLGAGYTVRVRDYVVRPWGAQRNGYVTLNEENARLWRDDADPIWQANGVWTDQGGKARVLRPYYFRRIGGRRINFVEDYLKPFLVRFTQGIREVQPRSLIFIEGVPNLAHPTWTKDDPDNVAYAGHWYDNATLFLKFFRRGLNADISPGGIQFRIGEGNVQAMFTRQIGDVARSAAKDMNGMPTLIGEFGVPFDLNNREAFRTGDFTAQRNALNMYFNGMDANLLSCTLWNYTADNCNERGDRWNDEDLSIFSRDQQDDPEDINSGGRALEAVVRPYPMATAGKPVYLSFDMASQTFTYRWKPNYDLHTPTVIYVPRLHYAKAYTVEGNHGLVFDPEPKNQRLYITIGAEFSDAVAEIVITPDDE
jgi:hypothetical protein